MAAEHCRVADCPAVWHGRQGRGAWRGGGCGAGGTPLDAVSPSDIRRRCPVRGRGERHSMRPGGKAGALGGAGMGGRENAFPPDPCRARCRARCRASRRRCGMTNLFIGHLLPVDRIGAAAGGMLSRAAPQHDGPCAHRLPRRVLRMRSAAHHTRQCGKPGRPLLLLSASLPKRAHRAGPCASPYDTGGSCRVQRSFAAFRNAACVAVPAGGIMRALGRPARSVQASFCRPAGCRPRAVIHLARSFWQGLRRHWALYAGRWRSRFPFGRCPYGRLFFRPALQCIRRPTAIAGGMPARPGRCPRRGFHGQGHRFLILFMQAHDRDANFRYGSGKATVEYGADDLKHCQKLCLRP